jgi:DNA-binding CsgD family transcriptional regulator
VITTFDTDEYIHGALKAGARGFLLKGAAPDQLIQAIHAAVHGDALIDPGVTARLLASFSANALAAVPIQPEEALTEREEEVLLTVARGKTNAEIGEELHISISTVKFHVASLMTKLAARNRVELAMWAYENEPREVDRYHPVIADPAAVPQARGATLDPWPCRDPGTPALAPDTSPIEADFGPSPVRLNAEPRFVGEEPTVIDGRTWDTEVVWGGAWAGPDQDRERPDPRIRAPLRRHRPSRRRPGRHPPNRRP